MKVLNFLHKVLIIRERSISEIKTNVGVSVEDRDIIFISLFLNKLFKIKIIWKAI